MRFSKFASRVSGAGVLASFFFAVSAFASASVSYFGHSVAISNDFQQPMQCILQKLEAGGYHAHGVGCFGYRPSNASAHPTGNACDVDQTARDVTQLNKAMSSSQQISLAEGCQAVSGCKWHNSDCGHFEQRSAPYSEAGTPPQSSRNYMFASATDYHVSGTSPDIFTQVMHMYGLI